MTSLIQHGRRGVFTTTALGILMLIVIVVVSGCAVTESVSLQSMDATAPVAAPPIRIMETAEPSQFTISPHLSLPSVRNVSGILELAESGTTAPTVRTENNFFWKIPSAAAGVNIDYTMSSHAALAVGMSIAGMSGRSYGGWSAGLGFFNVKENASVRFDAGVQSTPIMYSAVTRIIRTYRDQSSDTTFSIDEGTDSHVNLYGALTLNSTRPTWPVNLFLQAYVTKQRFIDFVPHTISGLFESGSDVQAEASQWIIGVTPGLFMPVMEDVRIVIGERIIFPIDIQNQSPYPLLQFHMQLDVTM